MIQCVGLERRASNMQGLSVFNAPSVPGVIVTNWDSVATAQSVSKAAVDRDKGVHTQYGSMIETATRLCGDSEALRSTVSEVRKAEDWFSSQCNDGGQCTAVSNGGGAVRVFNSFQDVFLARSEQ